MTSSNNESIQYSVFTLSPDAETEIFQVKLVNITDAKFQIISSHGIQYVDRRNFVFYKAGFKLHVPSQTSEMIENVKINRNKISNVQPYEVRSMNLHNYKE